MKKFNIISFIAIILSFIGLALLKLTGMPIHIVISVMALVIMIICAVLDKKNWKISALEILYRVAYLITLITGILMIVLKLLGAVSIAHKVFAVIFVILFIVNFIFSLVKKKD